MNFTDKTFETLATFERYFKTACEADWCPNPGRAALDAMAEALTEKDGRRTAVNHSCGSCILRVVKRTGYLWFEDKAARMIEAYEADKAARDERPVEATHDAQDAHEAPQPSKAPAKKKTAATAKKTAKK